jgi:hypothetical protein
MPLPYPLRILVLASNPSATGKIEWEKEQSLIKEALRRNSDIEVHTLNPVTRNALRDKLLSETFHIIHFTRLLQKVRFPSILKQPVQEHAGNATAHLERLGWH